MATLVDETGRRAESLQGDASHPSPDVEDRLLSSVFAQAPVGFAVFAGPRYVIEQANLTVCLLWGRTQAQVLGRPLFEALPEAAGQGFEQLLDGVLATGVPFVGRELPVKLSRLDGGGIEEAFFNFVYAPLPDSQGNPRRVFLVASDSTEQVVRRRAAMERAARRERRSEDRLRRMVEASGAGTWEFEVASGRVVADARFLTLCGLPPEIEEFDAGQIVQAVAVDDRARVAKVLAAALSGEVGRHSVECRIHAGGPHARWVEARGQAQFDASGKVVSLAGTLMDVTARKGAQREREALLGREAAARAEAEKSRSRLAGLIENAPVFVCSTRGPTHIFEMANPRYLQLVRRSEEIIGLPVAEAMPEVVEQGFVRLLDGVFATGKPYVGKEILVQLARSEGGGTEEVYVTFIYQPRKEASGAVIGIDTFGFEVTEQVLARQRVEALAQRVRAGEAQLRLVTDAMPVLVSFVGADQRYRFVNRAYERWFGLSREEIVGHTLVEIIGSAAYAVLQPHILRGLAGEHVSFQQRAVPYRMAGARDVQATFVPHREADGRLGGYIALLQDVTEDNRRQEERELQRQLSSQFEQQLIGIVTHDLRSPVGAILLSAAALLRDEDLTERQTKNLVRIQTAAERVHRLIRDLLDFTQARLAGGIRIEPRATDLHEVLRAVVDEVEATHPGRALQLNFQGEARGVWDPDRLGQLVQNLVTNALKYSPEGSPVKLSTRVADGWVCFSVHNEGPPITAERQVLLFQPLQRGANERDRSARSIGLGLYIVKQVVDAHRGSVEVASTPEAGTTFTVRLPQHRVG